MLENGIQVIDNEFYKIIRSEKINLDFRKKDGYTLMWGENEETYSPIGSFIADIEITTICFGIPLKDGTYKLCEFCYKGNNSSGKYMNLETYKTVLNNLNCNNQITQVALGIDSMAETNPDLESILAYTRSIGIIPNLTVAHLTSEKADMLLKYCGAIACSRYSDKDVCYDTIKLLSDKGLKQVNMHFCIHSDNFDDVMQTLEDIKTDNRLAGLNAIVFLSLKKKGRGIGFNQLSEEKFAQLYYYCINNKINFGFDSCSANKVVNVAKKLGNYDMIKDYVEPCESLCMSIYSSVDGKMFPCSFAENIKDWETGIDLTKKMNFIDECWNNEKSITFRNNMLNNLDCNNCRGCKIYKI